MKNSKGNGGDDQGVQQTERLVAQAERLIIAMESIAKESGVNIAHLRERQDVQEDRQERQETRQKRQRRVTSALILTFLVDLIVTVAVIFTAAGVHHQAGEIEDIQGRVTGEVLCPLYQQFINSDTPAARERARASGQDMEAREHAFQVIREGYKTLECKPPPEGKTP